MKLEGTVLVSIESATDFVLEARSMGVTPSGGAFHFNKTGEVDGQYFYM